MKVSLASRRSSRRFKEVSGLFLLFLAVVSFLAIVSFDQHDPSWFYESDSQSTRNWAGWIGATLSEALLQAFGAAAFAVPLVLLAVGWILLRNRPLTRFYWKFLGYVVLGLSLAALLDLLYDRIRYGGDRFRFEPGGIIGEWTAELMVSVLNRPGAVVFSAGLVAAMIVLTTRFSLVHAAELISGWVVSVTKKLAAVFRALLEWRRRATSRRAVIPRHTKRQKGKPAPPTPAPPQPPEVQLRPSIPLAPARDAEAQQQEPAPVAAPGLFPGTKPRTDKAPAPLRQAALPMGPGEPGYSLPPLELLNEPMPQAADNEKELLERARQLTDKFREFAVDGNVVAIHPGPVVTTFEFKPDAGVKYSKIASMTDDLCLALKAESVRIDRMPGRSTVGIEVPNNKQEMIYPRELISSERFRNSRSKLTLALGKDIGGEVFTAELDRMPHLLIAGATGAGKSVMLNGMIVSILYKATPADARFIMIDTKMIELGVYADIPNLLVPVVTDSKQASTALKWAVQEMEKRYRKLAAAGVRNIEQFNKLIEKEPDRTMENEKGAPIPLRRLPYIVIVIDELADLIVSSVDVEESVMRLAQMARAVGLQLILATQRPSVDVLTGTIKANFPSRIAFRVSQRVDSRTIIDQNGAEQLLGRGDMLYLPSGSSRLMRLHSSYITEPELNRITAFLKKMARPVYDESVLKESEEAHPGYESGERDTMFMEAVRLVLQEGQCSITLLQRRLRLGYARAARIVDMMEQEGVVGPADGSKPRELLVGPEILETLEAPHQ